MMEGFLQEVVMELCRLPAEKAQGKWEALQGNQVQESVLDEKKAEESMGLNQQKYVRHDCWFFQAVSVIIFMVVFRLMLQLNDNDVLIPLFLLRLSLFVDCSLCTYQKTSLCLNPNPHAVLSPKIGQKHRWDIDLGISSVKWEKENLGVHEARRGCAW